MLLLRWLCMCIAVATTAAQTTCTFTSSSSCSGLTPTTCSGLCEYYQALGGDSWTVKTNWGAGSDVCTWYGIVCSSNVITGINHYTNNLVGTIPATFPTFSLQEIAIHNNAIAGTLSAALFRSTMKFIAVGVNSISGTIPSTLSTATSLVGFGLWRTSISGTIPTETSTITSLKYIFGFSSHLSGTLPFSNTAQPLQSVLFYENSISGEIPAAMASIGTLGELMMNHNHLSGTIPALVNTMRHFGVSVNKVSGTIPPSLSGSLLETFEAQDNRISGSIPHSSSTSYVNTTMYAVSRNYMTGNTDSLANANLLQTLALSSNRFSCNVVPLESATGLAVGTYSPPIVDVLTDVTEALNAENLLGGAHSDLFDLAQYNNTANDNLVIAFAGNPQLTDKSSQATAVGATNLRKKDAIMNGYVALFPGHSDFDQTLIIVLPALFLAHLCVVLFFCFRERSEKSSTWRHLIDYFRAPTSEMLEGCVHAENLEFLHRLEKFTIPALCCAGLGLVLIILNAASPNVFGSGACIDPLISTTLAYPEATPAVEWVWLVVVVTMLVASTVLFVQQALRQRARSTKSARVSELLELISLPPAALAVKRWRQHQAQHVWAADSKRRALVWVAYRVLHIVPMIVLGLPEVLYVMAQNSKRGAAAGSNFFMAVFGDSTFVSVIRFVLALFVAPVAADRLAKIRCWQHPPGLQQQLMVNSCALSALVNLQFMTGLSAVLTTFILDEACLRYYLNFNPGVDALMKQWDIAVTGAAAYRESVCCRNLISIYFYVWFTTALIQMFWVPCMELIKETKEVAALRLWASDVIWWFLDCCGCTKDSKEAPGTRSRAESGVELVGKQSSDLEEHAAVPEAWLQAQDSEEDERENLMSREHVEEMQISTSTFYTMVVLQGLVFGLWAPMLMLVMPLTCFLQLRARAWAWRHIVCSKGNGMHSSLTAGQLASQALLVQAPTTPVARWFFIALVLITPWAMYDLDFHLATIILFVVAVVICALYVFLSVRRISAGQEPYLMGFLMSFNLSGEQAPQPNHAPSETIDVKMPAPVA